MAKSARGGRIGIVSAIVLAVVVLVGVGVLAGVMAAVGAWVAWNSREGVVLAVVVLAGVGVLTGVGVAGAGVVVPERIATRLARDRIGISGIVLAVGVLVGVWVGVSVLVGVWVGVGYQVVWKFEGVVLAVVALVGVGVLVTVGVAGAGVVVPERIATRLARDRTGIVSGIVLAVGVLIAGGAAVGILVGVWAQVPDLWLEGYVTFAVLAAEGALMSVLVVVGVLAGAGVAVGARAARRRKRQEHAGGRAAAITKDG